MKKIHMSSDCDLTITSLLNAIEMIKSIHKERTKIVREFNKIKYIGVRVSIEQILNAFQVENYFMRYFKLRVILLHPIKLLKNIKFISFSCLRRFPIDYWEVVGFGSNSEESIIVYSNGV